MDIPADMKSVPVDNIRRNSTQSTMGRPEHQDLVQHLEKHEERDDGAVEVVERLGKKERRTSPGRGASSPGRGSWRRAQNTEGGPSAPQRHLAQAVKALSQNGAACVHVPPTSTLPRI